jgi:NhaA family Na+:H+ antiporter
LSDIRNAILPVFSALGGMAVPAGIYLLVNFGLPGQSGAGIPMATDIAFAIGMLSLLGKRVPPALKVFLVAMAIIDDLGAILVIAFFYSAGLSLQNLGIAGGIFALLLLLNRLRIHALLPYLAGGVAMWYFMLHSGVHATITGVLLAFAIPFGDGGEKSPSFILQHFLHAPVAFIILPVFALANTAIAFDDDWIPSLVQPVSLGILSGLIIGKPVGILLFSRIASASGLGNLPAGIKWTFLAGTGMLGGIGFTMSIFISLLAFEEARLIGQAKISVMLASLIAALSGLIWLYFNLPADSGDPNQSTEKNA